MGIPVKISENFIADLAREMVALSSNNAKSVIVDIQGTEHRFVLVLDPKELFQLSKLHQIYTSSFNKETMRGEALPRDLIYEAKMIDEDSKVYLLSLEESDFQAIFLTLDRVLAGADSPYLEGELNIQPIN